MSALTVIILIFSVASSIDYIFGSRLGLGKEFEKGFMLLGTMALSMIGMIVLSPLLADLLSPLFEGVYKVFKIDPSIIPASLFANDMGGAPLAKAVAKNSEIGMYNALVVSSMMGVTISFTIPFAMGLVDKKHHRYLAFGLLSGIVTVPVGCFVSGLICSLPIADLLLNLLPLTLLSLIIAAGLLFFPEICVKIFKALGFFIKMLIILGLMLGILNFLFGKEVVEGLGTIEEGALVCINASIVMTGMFPLIHIVSKLLKKPLEALGKKLGISSLSAMGIVSSLATSMTTFGVMNDMDDKGIMLNSAFAVSGAFTFASHLAFTMAFDKSYILPVIIGKLISGVLALFLAYFLFAVINKKTKKEI